MKPPDGQRGEALQANCSGLKVLLVDERSLIGATTLGWMEWMSRYGVENGAQSNQSWGGIPVVVFFGDDIQLPPVLDSPVYNCKSNVQAAMHGVLVWKEFNKCVILNTTVRQQGQDQEQFRSVLKSLRQYETNAQQAKWLQNFQWEELKKSHGVELTENMSNNGLFIFPTHQQEWEHNKFKLLQLNHRFPIAKITAKNQGPHAQAVADDKASGLAKTLYLCKHAKVTLTVNLAVKYGLFNRSCGKVLDIIYLEGRSPKDSLPDVVLVEFFDYSGPAFATHNPKLIPIVPIQRRVECQCGGCKRTQIPLRLGWGTTIHSCQGQTVGIGEANRYIVIHPGTKSFESRNPGALFVALSRAKSAGSAGRDPDFAWHPSVLVNEDRLCHKPNNSTMKARSNEVARLQSMSLATTLENRNLENDERLYNFLHNIQK